MQKYKVQWFSPSLVPNMTSMYHLRNILVKISLVLVTMDINTQGHILIFRMELINLKIWLVSPRKFPKPKTENGQIKDGIAKGQITDCKRIDKGQIKDEYRPLSILYLSFTYPLPILFAIPSFIYPFSVFNSGF